MDGSTFYNLIGISILISGAFLAARGFFSEKNKDLMIRTTSQFGNDEHFKSMLNQKYSEIIGFFLIIIGSTIQFVVLYLNLNCNLKINNKQALFGIIIGAFVLNILSIIIVKLIVARQSDRILIKGWVANYEELLPKINDADYAKKSCDNSLIQITNILKNRYPKFNNTDPKTIIEYAKRKFK